MGTNHVSGTAEASVVKFCARVGYVKSQQRDDKITLKRGVVRVKWLILNCGSPIDISGMAEARVVKFCLQVDYIKS